RSVGVAANRQAAREDVDVPAVLVAEAELAFVAERAAGDALVLLAGLPLVVGMQEPLPLGEARLDLVVRVAEHLLPPPGVEHRAGRQVPVPDPFLRAGEGQ